MKRSLHSELVRVLALPFSAWAHLEALSKRYGCGRETLSLASEMRTISHVPIAVLRSLQLFALHMAPNIRSEPDQMT